MMAVSTARPRNGGMCGLLACIAAFAAAPVEPQAQTTCAGTARLNVVIEGVRSDRGELVVELYADDEEGFLYERGRVQRVRQKAAASVTRACISAPRAGTYALVLYHDENSDQKFNRSLIGLPSEGFGFSNNVRPVLGAPSLKSVLIPVPDGESTVRVRMQYLGGQRG